MTSAMHCSDQRHLGRYDLHKLQFGPPAGAQIYDLETEPFTVDPLLRSRSRPRNW